MLVCAYCSTPLADGARTCSQCAAPRTPTTRSAPPPPAGFVLYVDAWAGFSVHRPQGWRASPRSAGVQFTSPAGAGILEIGRLAPHATATPSDHVRAILQGFPQGDLTVLRDEPQAATVRFRSAAWTGLIQVRQAGNGGLYAFGKTSDGSLNIEALVLQVLGSLGPIQPAPRTRFVDPHEGSFQIQLPEGWGIQHTFATPNGARVPWCRLAADPSGRTFVACEVDSLSVFVDRPRSAPAATGFFAALGQMAQQLEQGLSGVTPMPLQGLGPVIEHHYVPRWIAAIPGSTYAGMDAASPMEAYARMTLPDGTTRVIRIEAVRLEAIGPGRWGSVMAWFYQAPTDDLDRLEPFLRGVASSFQVSPQWRQREAQRQQQQFQQQLQLQHQQNQQYMQMSQQLHQARMHDIAAAGAASTAAWQTNQEISDLQMQGWQNSQASSDHSHHQTINGIRETADYQGPTGHVWNAPEVDRLWTDQQGGFVGGPAGLELGGDWTELKKL